MNKEEKAFNIDFLRRKAGVRKDVRIRKSGRGERKPNYRMIMKPLASAWSRR